MNMANDISRTEFLVARACDFTSQSVSEPQGSHQMRRLHLVWDAPDTVDAAERDAPARPVAPLRLPARPVAVKGQGHARPRRRTTDSGRLAGVLAERRARLADSLATAAPAARPSHGYRRDLMELDRAHRARDALYPVTDEESRAHERRMLVVARSMNTALAVAVMPVGFAMLAHSARRGADLRFSARITTLTGLFLAAMQQGLTDHVSRLVG